MLLWVNGKKGAERSLQKAELTYLLEKPEEKQKSRNVGERQKKVRVTES